MSRMKSEDAIGAKARPFTGAEYLASLRDEREVYIYGERVEDVTTHPAFAGMVHELARIYDLQHTAAYRDQMTFISPETGNRCSVSWMLPLSIEDLKLKRRNSEIWNEQCWGQLGRGPRKTGSNDDSGTVVPRAAGAHACGVQEGASMARGPVHGQPRDALGGAGMPADSHASPPTGRERRERRRRTRRRLLGPHEPA